MWCSFFIFGLLFGITEQTNSSLILSTITARAPSSSSSGRSSLSIASTYSGSLMSYSATFARPYSLSSSNYYYQAIQMSVYQSGAYSFTTLSSIDTYGCLYDTTFDAFNPLQRLIEWNDDGGSGQQFLINYNLQSGRTYILVVTTSISSTTGSYSLLANGPSSLLLTELTPVTTLRSGYISSSGSTFARPDRSSSSYYYSAIEVTPRSGGSYTFRSESSVSLDPYGCLYRNSFNPSYPSSNKLYCDDDSGGNREFQFTQYLSSSTTYILVVTTASMYITGSYTVGVTGPASVSMSTYYPGSVLTVGGIVGIVIGSLIFVAIVAGLVCACQRRRHAVTHTTVIPAQYHPGGQTVHYPHAHENAGYAPPPPYNPYGTPYPKV